MVTLGSMVGFDMDKISKFVEEKLKKHERLFSMLNRGDMPAQVAALLLRLCALPCMGYLLQVIPPPIIRQHAQTFDDSVIQTAINKLALPKSLSDQAILTLQLPVKLGGFGLRSAERTSHPAYYSSVSMA